MFNFSSRAVLLLSIITIFIFPTLLLAGDKNLACVQNHLSTLGYDAGSADGVMGRRTQTAATQFAEANSEDLPELSLETGEQWCKKLAKLVPPAPNLFLEKKEGMAFWTPPEKTNNCGGDFTWTRPYKLAVTLTRRPFPNDNGSNFAHYFGMGLSKTMAGSEVDEFKQYILKVAKDKTFTRANLKTRWSPIYIQSNLLRLMAMYVTYMDSTGQLTVSERQTIINWGNPMVAGQKRLKQNKSADSRAASGVALMSWGSVTDQFDLIKIGYKNWKEALPYVIGSIGKLRRHSAHRGVPIKSLSLEDEYNVAIAHVVEGAAVLENLGVDAFSIKYRGRTIHNAVEWWASVIGEYPRPKNFDGFRRANHNWHLAWIPIYVNKNPDRPISVKLRTMIEEITYGWHPMFEGVSLGGSTDCLWGYR